MSALQKSSSRYGRLGLDVGTAGRWSRLLWGILILAPLTINLYRDYDGSSASLSSYGQVLVYLIVILGAYLLVYWLLGRLLLERANAWLNTAIFVVPAFAVAWWDFLIFPITGVRLPGALDVAMLLYIGVSFLLQWRIRYGGCEVVSVPILLLGRRYPTYCIPLVALDAVEKRVVDRDVHRDVSERARG